MNVLGVGAHYDDLELGCSGALVKHVLAGDKVTMLVITDSGYRNPEGNLIRDARVAREEGEAAAALIGADLRCLGFPTFEVPFDENLTRTIQGIIEELETDFIYCPWDEDLHRDHSYTAKSTLMAGRHVPRFLMYRSNYYEPGHQFGGNFYSDISAVMDRKIEVIKAHKSELERNRHAWLDFFVNQNANHGRIIGVKYAECFKIVRYLA